MVAQMTLLSSPSQGQSPLASQLMQNMSENEALQFQLRATSCPRGNKCSLGTSTHGSHRSMEHQGQRMCIDPVLNLLEVGTVKDKTSKQVTKTFECLWLSRYPQPRTCVHDRGPIFVAHEFQSVLEDTGLGSRPTSAQNHQSNGIIEQVHCMITAIIKNNFLLPIDTVEKANDKLQDALHKAMHVVHCASHNLLDNISPGALTFR
jgi:hypothetical protein